MTGESTSCVRCATGSGKFFLCSYAVPVLAGFDAIRNCSHCRRNTDDDCKAWREARGAVAVLRQEARRLAKGVDELRDATGGRTSNIYQFSCGSGAYFAPDAPDFQDAGELKGDALGKAVCILESLCTASTILAGCVNRFCRSDSFSDC